MEQHTAVKKMMLSIKLEETIPEECYPYIREYLKQMYGVGFDAGREDKVWEMNNHSRKTIVQYNLQGHIVNTFGSLREAVKRTGFSKEGIIYSMKHDSPTRQRWLWKYINKESLIAGSQSRDS